MPADDPRRHQLGLVATGDGTVQMDRVGVRQWLLKVPPHVGLALDQMAAGQAVGEITVEKRGADERMTMRLDDAVPARPSGFELRMTVPDENMQLVSEDERGRLVAEGAVGRRLTMVVDPTVDSSGYEQLKRERLTQHAAATLVDDEVYETRNDPAALKWRIPTAEELEAQQKARARGLDVSQRAVAAAGGGDNVRTETVQQADGTMVTRVVREERKVSKASERYQKKRQVDRSSKALDKRFRSDRSTVKQMLYQAFEVQSAWTTKELVERTQQPTDYLKRDILREIADFHDTGEMRNKWTLKREYRAVKKSRK